jgi:succinate dehydrogenase / fumarate reductase, cytochrome b subunit
MNWLADTLTSSIGKKLLMALTGFSFILFLTMHLAGNLTLLGGRSMFNAYADRLHELGMVLVASEYGLLLLAIVHVVTGLSLFWHNIKARPVRYHVNKSAGGRTIGSATMPYTGILLIVFIVVPSAQFQLRGQKSNHDLRYRFKCLFQSGLCDRVCAAMILAAVHVSHGFWSAFQTIGANHPKYMPAIRVLSVVFALLIGIGFGMLPIIFPSAHNRKETLCCSTAKFRQDHLRKNGIATVLN